MSNTGNMGNDQGLIINESTGENIAVTYKKENAAFIIKACNLHDELVKALKDFVDSYEACGECELAWHEAKELLAKVQEV